MDWRNRKYYAVTFASNSQNMRVQHLKDLDGVKVRPFNNTPKQKDEKCGRGWYNYMISVPLNKDEAVLHELKKAKRNDGFCSFEEIKPAKRILAEDIIEKFIEKVSNDSIDGIEDFLGYCISANILEGLENHIRGVLYHGLSDEEFEVFRKKYGI